MTLPKKTVRGGVMFGAMVVLSLCGCRASESPKAPDSASTGHVEAPSLDETAPVHLPGLENVVAYAPDYYSGGVPVGEAGFESLKSMGIRTVISVDGSIPDLEAAKARGLRYIHLPIGYGGFDEARKRELVRATRDALGDGPVYVHCHHGKHRSAGAAAAVVASLGWATPDEMVDRMKVSGTSAHYEGLYACAATSVVLTEEEIDAVPTNFPEVSMPTGMVRSMVDIGHAWEHLKQIEKAGWQAPEDHPDLVAVLEASKLADLLRFVRESPDRDVRFNALMDDNWREAQALEDMLHAGASPEALTAQYKTVGASCKACHLEYRD